MDWEVDRDLSAVRSLEELRAIYSENFPKNKGVLADQHTEQVARFLFSLKPGDTVITPSYETELIYHGTVKQGGYYYNQTKDGCPYPHRRPVHWSIQSVPTREFSEAFQKNLRSSLNIFPIARVDDFLDVVNKDKFKKEDLKT